MACKLWLTFCSGQSACLCHHFPPRKDSRCDVTEDGIFVCWLFAETASGPLLIFVSVGVPHVFIGERGVTTFQKVAKFDAARL